MVSVNRRQVLTGSAALLAAGPACAEESLDQLLGEVFAERRPKPGVIGMKLSPLAENGLAVPITLSVAEAPANVKRIVLLAPGNPFPRAAEYRFGPRAGKAEISTRIRLARSQTVTAVAELGDGSLWSTAADITITSGACAEIYDAH
jgi:sulfur-oxidizing protein SoxY